MTRFLHRCRCKAVRAGLAVRYGAIHQTARNVPERERYPTEVLLHSREVVAFDRPCCMAGGGYAILLSGILYIKDYKGRNTG